METALCKCTSIYPYTQGHRKSLCSVHLNFAKVLHNPLRTGENGRLVRNTAISHLHLHSPWRQFLIAFQVLVKYKFLPRNSPLPPTLGYRCMILYSKMLSMKLAPQKQLHIAHFALLSDLFSFAAEGQSKGHRELAPLLILLLLSV